MARIGSLAPIVWSRYATSLSEPSDLRYSAASSVDSVAFNLSMHSSAFSGSISSLCAVAIVLWRLDLRVGDTSAATSSSLRIAVPTLSVDTCFLPLFFAADLGNLAPESGGRVALSGLALGDTHLGDTDLAPAMLASCDWLSGAFGAPGVPVISSTGSSATITSSSSWTSSSSVLFSLPISFSVSFRSTVFPLLPLPWKPFPRKAPTKM